MRLYINWSGQTRETCARERRFTDGSHFGAKLPIVGRHKMEYVCGGTGTDRDREEQKVQHAELDRTRSGGTGSLWNYHNRVLLMSSSRGASFIPFCRISSPFATRFTYSSFRSHSNDAHAALLSFLFIRRFSFFYFFFFFYSFYLFQLLSSAHAHH